MREGAGVEVADGLINKKVWAIRLVLFDRYVFGSKSDLSFCFALAGHIKTKGHL